MENGILKLQEIFQQGYVPSRENEEYTENVYYKVNCMEHACFNLTNEQIRKCNFNEADRDLFQDFFLPAYGRWTEALAAKLKSQRRLISIIKAAGLNISKCKLSKPLENNQWNIAFYYQSFGFHFLLQHKNGVWQGKRGWFNDEVEEFDNINQITLDDNVYSNPTLYTITNPYAEK